MSFTLHLIFPTIHFIVFHKNIQDALKHFYEKVLSPEIVEEALFQGLHILPIVISFLFFFLTVPTLKLSRTAVFSLQVTLFKVKFCTRQKTLFGYFFFKLRSVFKIWRNMSTLFDPEERKSHHILCAVTGWEARKLLMGELSVLDHTLDILGTQ